MQTNVEKAALSALTLCVRMANETTAKHERQIELLNAELAYERAVKAEAIQRMRDAEYRLTELAA